MQTLVEFGHTLKTLLRTPFGFLLASGINLIASFRTFFFPEYPPLYKSLGPNKLRVLKLLPPLTNRISEPVRVTLDHVSLEHTPAYKTWDQQADPNLRLWKRYRAWATHVGEKLDKEKDWFEQLKRFEWGEYIALSYTWGPSDPPCYIILNGRYFPVSQNLEAALRAARVGWDQKLVLWVDALCINQSNLGERGVQVQRMRELYGGAAWIIIHLGAESNDLGMRTIRTVADKIKKGFDWREDSFRIATSTKEGEPNSERDALIAAFKVFTLSYWSRMWIIQELAMAQDYTCCSGNEWVSLADIRQVMKLFVLNTDSLIALLPEDYLTNNVAEFQSTVGILWWIGRVRELTMLTPDREHFTYAEIRSPILSLAQSANATDARDKVYGLLGLLPNKISTMMDLKSKNYTISTHDLFLKFAKSIIQVTNELDVIFARNFQQSSENGLLLPSWATDWTLKPIRTTGASNSSEWYFAVEEGYETVDEPNKMLREWNDRTNAFRSDGGRNPKIGFSGEDKLLSCEGFCIGMVDGMAVELPSATIMSSVPEQFTHPMADKTPYSDESEATKAILRTLGLDPSGEETEDSGLFHVPWFGAEADSDANGQYGSFTMTSESGTEYWAQLREKGWDTAEFLGSFFSFESARRSLGMTFIANGRPFKDYFPSFAPPRPEKANFAHIFRTVVSNLIGRRLITTKTGHIGMAPATIELTDKIYILVGCSMPVLLRPAENERYEVVGECYVDGFMKGEAMESLDAGNYQLESIVLC